MKLYIAYGTEADQVIALRLQALAAVNGLSAYVPPVYTRRAHAINLEPESHAKLLDSDVVLGVVTTSISDTLRRELEAARELLKQAMLIADPLPLQCCKITFRGGSQSLTRQTRQRRKRRL